MPVNSGPGLSPVVLPGRKLVPLNNDMLALSWDAEIPTYRIDAPDIVEGLLYRYGSGSGPTFNPMSYRIGEDTDDWSGYLMGIHPALQPPVTPYSQAFYLSKDGVEGSYAMGIFGLATPASVMPGTGVVHYRNPDTEGDAVAIDIDFARRTVTGKVPVTWVDAWGPYGSTYYSLEPITIATGAREFEATFNVPGAPTQGRIYARLMGPQGDQLAIAFRAPATDPYTLQYVEVYGTWITYRCIDCTSP